ncbi:MAG TPA: hypothetical protein VIZ60_11125 [Rubrobacter sp.]|jgi:LuxR family maltose regulon positive regulatory protein
MHLVIASHTEPPLPLPRLLAANDLTNITASDLRFTLEEAAEFLGGVTGLDLYPLNTLQPSKSVPRVG